MSSGTALRLLGAAAVVVAVIGGGTGASAAVRGSNGIDPGAKVNGMSVVQGLAREAKLGLFTDGYCDPVVLSAGRRTRSCRSVPRTRRMFVGYGVFAPKRRIDAAWNKVAWAMWIDGQQVSLARFGHSDRWLYDYPPADGRDVVLREWSIILVGAKGRHSIRFRTRLPQGVFDTTWRFAVEA
jgi:hypothetical protein